MKEESSLAYVLRMACAVPFKLIHRVFGAIMGAIIVSSLIALLAGVVLALVVTILGTIVAGAIWLCVTFASMIVGSGLLALARVFDSNYFHGKENTAVTVMNAVKSRGDGLRDMAKEHL